MAIIIKKGEEMRVAGRAIEPEKQRKGIFGIVDAMSLSKFKSLPVIDRMTLLRDARIVERKFLKAAKYQKEIECINFGTDGIKEELLSAACAKWVELQSRLPSYGYTIHFVRNFDEFDADDLKLAMLYPDFGRNEMPFTARLVQFAVLKDGSKGAFTTREIIDIASNGRQIRWRAFVKEKGKPLIEVAEDHAYESERPVFIEIVSDGAKGLAIVGFGWEKKI